MRRKNVLPLPAWFVLFLLGLSMVSILSACSQAQPAASSATHRLKVVATTTIVGDVVRNIGGEDIELSVLLPVGADPHSFQPTPQDVALIASADVVFANGAGLEVFLNRLIENAGAKVRLVSVSDGIELIGPPVSGSSSQSEEQTGNDPHVWMDPTLVMHWSEVIEQTLSTLDAQNASNYHNRAEAYRQKLAALDDWIRQQVAQVPEANRKLVSDHLVFGYFARRYGFEQVGAVIPGYSSMAEPSAEELASLENTIRNLNVKAVFVESSVNPTLAEQVANDTHTRLVTFFGGSLSAPDGPAGTYLDYMHYNVSVIVEALK